MLPWIRGPRETKERTAFLALGPLIQGNWMCERQFLTSFRHFYVLDENRTCSISIRLDQKSCQFLIFPRSILQNIFTK